ncbi:hypothetical protein VTO73DRAFT_13539 [Trametes versicolor]
MLAQRSRAKAVGCAPLHVLNAPSARATTPPCDVAQFFPSMNHDLLCRIMDRVGFSPILVRFFRHYLTGRHSCFRWGRASSPWFDVPEVGAGQGSALSPVLTNLYIAPALHILFPVTTTQSDSALQFYVDDGLWIVSTPSIDSNCTILRMRYQETKTTLARLGLLVESEKDELMHFVPTRLAASQNPQTPLIFDDNSSLQPSAVWRYLGIRLDSKLNFHAHVSYYAERAVTTVNAMLMLSNSNRGLTPMQRRTLYIACVLPLLTYGVEVWYRSKGVKGLMKPLVAAQHRALRWITGAFRTTPIGAMHSFAGILPLHLHCKKLQYRFFLRFHTLPPHHPLRASFPNIFKHSPNAPYIRFPPHLIRPTPAIPLSDVFDRERPWITEVFNPLDDECQPGARVRDLYADRITMHLDHPPKSDKDALDVWINTDLLPRIRAAHQDEGALVIFTDGSSYVTSSERDVCGSAAGYRAYNRGQLVRPPYTLYTGNAFSFDCEQIALSLAIGFVCLKSYRRVHIFSDSENSLSSILSPDGGKMAPTNSCRMLREWFERSPDHHIQFHYCPAHSDIEENEAIDADVKATARTHVLDLPNDRYRGRLATSYAYSKSGITEGVLGEWDEMANTNPAKYWGRTHLRHPAFRRLTHTKSYPLKRLGGRPTLTARFIRMTSLGLCQVYKRHRDDVHYIDKS